jgi:hypothetical protein
MTERKKLDGKSFVRSLDGCQTSKEVFGLLGTVLGSEKMRDRAKNVSDLPQIVKLDARRALLSAMSGKDTSNQDCMNMAANKYIELTGNTVKQFKLEVNKHATKMELERSAEPTLNNREISTRCSPMGVELGG